MKDVKQVTAMVVDTSGNYIALAERLSREFKTVYYCIPSWVDSYPNPNKTHIGLGIEAITVVENPFDVYDEVDFWIFPDTYYGAFQEFLREQGEITWGSGAAEELELYRHLIKEEMKALGLPVGKWDMVDGMTALREYLQKNENKWVKVNKWRGLIETFFSENYKLVKPSLDDIEFNHGIDAEEISFICEEPIEAVEMGYDGYTVDGKYPAEWLSGLEVKDKAYIGQWKKYANLPPALTEFNTKFAASFKEYGYRGFFSLENRIVGKKSYMTDFTARCFDKETEVLTKSGWKLFKNCSENDLFATRNINGEIEYEKATNYYERHYTGDMIRITDKKNTIDCVVHPEHDVLRYDKNKKSLFKEQASKLSGKGYIPRSAKWQGDKNLVYFSLPEYHNEWDFVVPRNKQIFKRIKHEPSVSIPLLNWAEFLGWYIAEGSNNGYQINISQYSYCDELEKCVKGLPFKYRRGEKGIEINSIQLTEYLKQFGLCDKKFVPDYIKNASPEIISKFLYGYYMGDGSGHGKTKRYITTSRVLADDIQELILKTGKVGNINIRKTKGTLTTGFKKRYVRNHDIYIITECVNVNFWFETGFRKNQFVSNVPYNDNIYCVSVPNGTLYVRRNGRPFWSGNCPCPPGAIYLEMIENLGAVMWAGANGEIIPAKPVAQFGIELLIESEWAKRHTCAIYFPKEAAQFVKLKRNMLKEGDNQIVPIPNGTSDIGSIVGLGDTLEQAKKAVLHIAEVIKGTEIVIRVDALDNAEEAMKSITK